jgi:hypothetical protein
MKNIFFVAFWLFSSLFCTSQDILRPSELVDHALKSSTPAPISLFSISPVQSRSALPSELKEYTILSLDKNVSRRVLSSELPFITIQLPQAGRTDITLDLVEVSPLAQDFVVRVAPEMKVVKVNPGKHYRGIIRGQSKSIAAISIFDNEVMGIIAHPNASGNMVLGNLADQPELILYQDDQILNKLANTCATVDSGNPYDLRQLEDHGGDGERALTDCVRLYLEVDNDIYINKGSNNANVTSYVTGLFNQVSALYTNEQINTVVSEIVIWSTPSPYNATTSIGMLNAFTAYRQGFNGDLAQLLSYKATGGVAYVDGLCRSNPDNSMSYAGISSSYQNVPTYSWSVEVCTHEFGHLFGSQHTHACVWNGNGTSIDGCYAPEGNCGSGPIPTNGGTIMSYCHLTNAGINFANGFGSQPGSVIRNKVIAASCLQACAGGGGGGGTPTCTQNQLTLTLRLDNYPSETTWNIKNTAGTILYSGGGYTTPNSTQTIALCLPTACFTFTINDAYGDGICCAYGQGFYNIKQGANTLISGGTFGATEAKSFCASGTSTAPTCTDGIQNGQETGVDCGGPTCPACPTCTDGIKNGLETSIDCGGPTCPACPTCTDGIKNGLETGVDCGGPTCPACPTCTDGVQNGQETGVDCGGPQCSPCGNGGNNGNVQITNLSGHYFETDWNGWIDGGIDCYRYVGSLSPEGQYSIRLRDNEAEFSAMTSSDYILNTYDSVTVEFKFRAVSFEPGKDFWLRYFNGSAWTTVKTFVSGTDFVNDVLYTKKVKISGPLAPLAKFRFQSDADDNSDNVYIDAVVIKGYKTLGVTTTCTDGIQNGQETGIDCGGPTCPACPTCNDGIQNGQETGVDCGGPLCGACSSCTDGIQNGQETGVDCGGPLCSACPSCTDGVQNGQETGIDCGGPNCSPCGTGGGGGSTTTLTGHYFETGWDGWIDGGVDCYRYVGIQSPEGQYSIRLRDNSVEASAMTSPLYNLAQYNSAIITFKFKAEGMEAGEDFFVQYSNGSTWTTIATFVSGTSFENGIIYTVNATRSGLHNNASFRIVCDGTENDDIIYIDAVVITATQGSLLPGSTVVAEVTTPVPPTPAVGSSDIKAFPNPVTGVLTITSKAKILDLTVRSITGREISKISVDGESAQIEMGHLMNGIYLITITDERGTYTKRIIKQ